MNKMQNFSYKGKVQEHCWNAYELSNDIESAVIFVSLRVLN